MKGEMALGTDIRTRYFIVIKKTSYRHFVNNKYNSQLEMWIKNKLK